MTDAAVVARPPRIFLSYTFEDRDVAQRVRRILSREAGARVFADDMLEVGARWSERLRQEIADCDAFLIIEGPRTYASDFVLQELGGAWALDKPIIIVSTGSGRARLPVEARGVRRFEVNELEREGVAKLLAGLDPHPGSDA